MSSPGNLPTVITVAGLQPQSPIALRTQLIAIVSSTNPGYTADLPGSLIEDISSTNVGAILLCDAARVELVNSLTPYASNAFLLVQLGNIYGVQADVESNTSVYVVFSGTIGFPIPPGFTVSDGTYQYTVQDGGVIESGGTSEPLFCLATIPGIWTVAAGTVTSLVTSVPSTITLSCVNPLPGTPGGIAQTQEQFRASVLQAGLAASQGMPRYLKTLLGNVPGVQTRLISVVQVNGGGWEILCGGGDPYAVANAIYEALFDVSTIVGSTIAITGITNANPGVATTNLNHGLTTGQTGVTVAGVMPSGFNAANKTVTVISEKTFSYATDTTGAGAYSSGGVVTPNPRNISVDLIDYPNTYSITFVNPPQQTVAVSVTWNTNSPNYVSPAAVQQLGAPALINYINAIPVGQPINLFALQETFQLAIASAVPAMYLTRMIFVVTINGDVTAPPSGYGTISGDPESYFFAASNAITINQG